MSCRTNVIWIHTDLVGYVGYINSTRCHSGCRFPRFTNSSGALSAGHFLRPFFLGSRAPKLRGTRGSHNFAGLNQVVFVPNADGCYHGLVERCWNHGFVIIPPCHHWQGSSSLTVRNHCAAVGVSRSLRSSINQWIYPCLNPSNKLFSWKEYLQLNLRMIWQDMSIFPFLCPCDVEIKTWHHQRYMDFFFGLVLIESQWFMFHVTSP